MRGIGHTLSRLPAARALVAGAAILATAALPGARAAAQDKGAGDQTAMAIPRIEAPGNATGVVLPQPLTPSEVVRVRRIFVDQAHGRMQQAERETAALGDKLLLGPILADRYLGRFHHSTPEELRGWLDQYGDQPDASAIHALLLRRLPRHAHAPALSPPVCLAPAGAGDAAPGTDPAAHDPPVPRDPSLERAIDDRVQAGKFDAALRLIAHRRHLQPSVAAVARAEVARGLFAANWDGEALQVAGRAWAGTGREDRVGQPAFVAGLAAWRIGHLEKSRFYFQQAAEAPLASADLRAAGAFWAARAALRLHDGDGSTRWLRRAAAEKLTFYGLLARRRLGWPVGLIPERRTLALADLEALAAFPRATRAFALLQVGEHGRAEQEFRCLWPDVADDPALRQALLMVALRAGLTRFAAQIAPLIETAAGIPHDAFDVPVPNLEPAGGFRFDPALVYGMTRAESNFDPDAVSPAGARGLMQLMPVTARAVSGNAHLPAARLAEPGFNLDLGQRFVLSLAGDDQIGNDLIAVLASYNAGLGGFTSWRDQDRAGSDPLLFIEAIPVTETRGFVKRALTYTWIYAAQLGLEAPSLDAMASGNFPLFTPASTDARLEVSLH